MKVCKRCVIEKDVSLFNKVSAIRRERPSRGGQGVTSKCKQCISEIRKPGLAEERAKKLELHKSNHKQCNVCREILAFEKFRKRKASIDGLSHTCADCTNKRCEKWREDNPGAHKRWYTENKEHKKEYYKEWRSKNVDRCKSTYAEWARNNKPVVNALIAKRTATKKQAVPVWANQDEIRKVYTLASQMTQETGIRHEVDHIYQLQSDLVCGLHWEGNLQVLTKVENIRKKNKLPEELR